MAVETMGWPGKNDKSYRVKVSPIEYGPSAGFIGAAASPNRETLMVPRPAPFPVGAAPAGSPSRDAI